MRRAPQWKRLRGGPGSWPIRHRAGGDGTDKGPGLGLPGRGRACLRAVVAERRAGPARPAVRTMPLWRRSSLRRVTWVLPGEGGTAGKPHPARPRRPSGDRPGRPPRHERGTPFARLERERDAEALGPRLGPEHGARHGPYQPPQDHRAPDAWPRRPRSAARPRPRDMTHPTIKNAEEPRMDQVLAGVGTPGLREAGLAGASHRSAPPRPDLIDRGHTAAGPDRLGAASAGASSSWLAATGSCISPPATGLGPMAPRRPDARRLVPPHRRLVGAAHLRTELMLDALEMAAVQREPSDVIHHELIRGPSTPPRCPAQASRRRAVDAVRGRYLRRRPDRDLA